MWLHEEVFRPPIEQTTQEAVAGWTGDTAQEGRSLRLCVPCSRADAGLPSAACGFWRDLLRAGKQPVLLQLEGQYPGPGEEAAGEEVEMPGNPQKKQLSPIPRWMGPEACVHLSVICPSAGVPMLSVQPKGKQKGCAGCNRKIKDRYLLKALDKYWHEDCLKCACCDCRLGEVGSTLYTKANLILCRRDYLRWASCQPWLLCSESSHPPGPGRALPLPSDLGPVCVHSFRTGLAQPCSPRCQRSPEDRAAH